MITWNGYGEALLALTIWREARGEPFEGMVAIAYSVLDRVHNPKWWGKDLASVLTKKWQYSSMTAPNDPQLAKYPAPNDANFQKSLLAANAALYGQFPNPVPSADSYYAVTIGPPSWADPNKMIARIGNHIFFNTDGSSPDNLE